MTQTYQTAAVDTSPRLTRSQNLRSFHTRPMPRLSSQRLMPSSRSLTLPFHLDAIHCRNPSLTLSFSMAIFLATSPGAMWTLLKPGTHSFGSTQRSTKHAGEGRVASRRESRMDTRERASRRETTDVCVKKMEREMRSANDGREEDQSRGGRTQRVRRRR